MGVKGFLRALSNQYTVSNDYSCCKKDIELPPGTALFIDGYGFMFSIIESQKGLEYVNRPLGGSYIMLHKLIEEEILKLRVDFRLELVFFFDNGHSTHKQETIDERSIERENSWASFYSYCEFGMPNPKLKIPLPPLVLNQFRRTLESFDVEIIECDGEADQVLATTCLQYNNAYLVGSVGDEFTECFPGVCYANDSDFYFMKDCPYVPIGNLEAHPIEKGFVCRARELWTRDVLAASLGLTQDQLVELAILIGNDYTKHFSRMEYDVKVSISGYKVDAIESLREFIIERGPDFRLKSSDNAHLQKCIELSRATYNLESVEEFEDINKDEKDEDNEDEDDNESVMALEEDQENFIESEIETFREQVIAYSTGTTENTSNTSPSGSVLSKFVINLLEKSQFTGEDDIFPEISPAHVEAFKKMVDFLENGLSNDYANTMANIDAVDRPKWKDVCASHTFQNICKAVTYMYDDVEEEAEDGNEEKEDITQDQDLIDGLAKLTVEEKPKYKPLLPSQRPPLPIFNPHPQDYFDGPIFHVIMKVEDEEAAEAAAALLAAAEHANTNAKASVHFPDILPIDEHRDSIVNHISTHRVTIIHGETGCGKSSRIPVFLYEDAKRKGLPCTIYVSQPRRIAVMGLYNRLKKDLGHKVGYKMGFGARECTDETDIFFVTTGYLVQFLGGHRSSWQDITHLIIDEVHERSMDGDIVCLFAKNILKALPHLKIVLMSATIHIEMYKSYFGSDGNDDNDEGFGPIECLSVGAKRFPVKILHAEDLASGQFSNHPVVKRWASDIVKDTTTAASPFSLTFIHKNIQTTQYRVAENIIRSVIPTGQSVLVFVSGMADIVEIASCFGEDDTRYKICPVHSDIPLDDQMDIFELPEHDEVKVILATNAAESSITLPDLDYVICLGTHKALTYNARGHMTQLVGCWISKASATQRAGRTGRTRPGTVFRLYSKKLYDAYPEHEEAEVHRTTHEEMIIKLRSTLEKSLDFTGVMPVLENLIEPPDLDNIEKSFASLHVMNMISEPNDNGALTSTGIFAGKLGIGVSLSRLVVYGIMFGIGPEAVIITSALLMQQTIFRTANPLVIKDPDELNDVISGVFLSSVKLDNFSYSEPFMLYNSYLKWHSLRDDTVRKSWAFQNSIVFKRWRLFISNCRQLLIRVKGEMAADYKHPNMFDYSSLKPLNKSTKNILRVIMTWINDDKIIHLKGGPRKEPNFWNEATAPPDSDFSVDCMAKLMSKAGDSIPWRTVLVSRVMYDAPLQRSLNNEIHDLLLSATSVSGMHTVPITWVTSWSTQKKKYNCQFCLSDDVMDYLLIFWSMSSNAELQLRQAEYSGRSYSSLSDDELAFIYAFALHKAIPNLDSRISDRAQTSNNYILLQVDNVSKTETFVINDLYSTLPLSISLLIPPDGNKSAKLSCSQVIIDDITEWVHDEIALKNIFDDAIHSNIHLKSSSGVEKLKFTFPNSTQGEENAHFIRDAPLGLRLINSYKCVHKEKIIKLRDPLNFDNILTTKIQCPTTFWEMVDSDTSQVGSKGIAPHANAFLPRMSVVGVATHIGRGQLYAVCNSLLALGKGAETNAQTKKSDNNEQSSSLSKIVAMSGVSILPPGCRWILMALFCGGVSNTSVPQTFSERKESVLNDGVIDHPLSIDDLHECYELYADIDDALKKPILYNPDITQRIINLFEAWTVESENEDSHTLALHASIIHKTGVNQSSKLISNVNMSKKSSDNNNNNTVIKRDSSSGSASPAAPIVHTVSTSTVRNVVFPDWALQNAEYFYNLGQTNGGSVKMFEILAAASSGLRNPYHCSSDSEWVSLMMDVLVQDARFLYREDLLLFEVKGPRLGGLGHHKDQDKDKERSKAVVAHVTAQVPVAIADNKVSKPGKNEVKKEVKAKAKVAVAATINGGIQKKEQQVVVPSPPPPVKSARGKKTIDPNALIYGRPAWAYQLADVYIEIALTVKGASKGITFADIENKNFFKKEQLDLISMKKHTWLKEVMGILLTDVRVCRMWNRFVRGDVVCEFIAKQEEEKENILRRVLAAGPGGLSLEGISQDVANVALSGWPEKSSRKSWLKTIFLLMAIDPRIQFDEDKETYVSRVL